MSISSNLPECSNSGIHEWFEVNSAKTPNAIALIFGNTQLTYQELNQRANCLAHYLRRLNVGPDTLVGLHFERSLEMIIGLLAILKAGGAYVPFDPAYPDERLSLMLSDSQISVMLSQQHPASWFSARFIPVVCLETDWEAISQEPDQNPEPLATPDNLAYVIYTSGSTGTPKGVMIEHASLVNFVRDAGDAYGVVASDRVLQFSSINFDQATEEIFITLTRGATLVLRTPDMMHSVPSFFKACNDFGLTVLDLPTAFWHKLCGGLPTSQFPETVRLVLIGGERALLRWLTIWKTYVSPDVRLINTYGPTESTIIVTWCNLVGENAVYIDNDMIPIGKPLPSVQTYVLDVDMQTVRVGEIGELYIGGAGLARGYLNRPQLTADRFVYVSIHGNSPVRVYKTGDLVRCRPDGHLEFLDRSDRQEKIRGFRVELREIETVLAQHTAVQQAIVVARDDASGDKHLIAYVIQDPHNGEYLDGANRSQLEAEQINQWRFIHNDGHLNPAKSGWDETFNISGWVSTYTNSLIPDHEMHEWVDNTVERILALQPRQVLEIGCGTGLLLFRIAPSCTRYVGTDFSETALKHVNQQLKQSSINLPQVVLEQRTADNFEGLTPQSFDTIIINSVIQYFPSLDYLLSVIKQAVEIVKTGGMIFIGDIRNYALQEVFAASVELFQAPKDLLTDDLCDRIQKRLDLEGELTVDPQFFTALQHHLPQITHIQVVLKRGEFENELTQFRYDAILHIRSESPAPVECPSLDWQQQRLTVAALRQRLVDTCPLVLGIHNVPNARVLPAVKALQVLNQSPRPTPVEELRQTLAQRDQRTGVDPEDLWKLSQDLPYDINVNWLEGRADGHYDVLIKQRSPTSEPSPLPIELVHPYTVRPQKPLQSYSNNPLKEKVVHQLSRQLRSYLQQRLPDYMVPSSFVAIASLPLTPNGKVDVKALPSPVNIRPNLDGTLVSPKTPLERELAVIWSTVLDIEEIGITDNFFELGGNSLRLMELMSQVEQTYQSSVSLDDFFKVPTISGLVQQIQQTTASTISAPDKRVTLQQLQVEAALDFTIDAPVVDKTRWTTPQTILLTGATGFIGASILSELLQKTDATIHCLIRAQNLTDAYQKLRQISEKYRLDLNPFYSRIIPVVGNLAQPLLGLSRDKFQALANTIDVVYHSAANVNLVLPYAALKAVNVIGTKSILAFASHGKLKPVHFMSTLDVFEARMAMSPKTIYEHDAIAPIAPIAQDHEITGGYAQSKWVAEQLVSQAGEAGLPICIYRLGMISGSQHSGICNTEDVLCRLLKSFIDLKAAPQIDLNLDMTPVDYVSQATVYLSRQPTSFGQSFHLVNPKPIALNQILQQINNLGYAVKRVPYEQWEIMIQETRNALSPLATLITTPLQERQISRLEGWLAGSQLFDCQHTLSVLNDSGIACPEVDGELLDKYFTNLFDNNFTNPFDNN
ncbi:MAG: amino acid adenylation domain-containing protein [Elainellaceae cyanobacterium]